VETVHSYRKSLMKKLDLHNVAAVAHFAARVGLLAIVSKKEPE
jgi:DNA-binding CsgD family transcriptional regulator